MTYVFDIDGTICSPSSNGDYSDAMPFVSRIKYINLLYDGGHEIVFYTARGMGRTNNDRKKAEKIFSKLTTEQLDQWGVKYNKLYFGKPSGDLYVDDKGMFDTSFFGWRG